MQDKEPRRDASWLYRDYAPHADERRLIVENFNAAYGTAERRADLVGSLANLGTASRELAKAQAALQHDPEEK